ncbi:MAG: hypothetical protein D6798_17095 [Deltaproteobacteria bacterium]|nr:MAG: hypothetical protein D6798_17095 [Deltaproteobacteria bacterium]
MAVGIAAASVFWLLQELLLMQPRVVELDPEELYNAAHGEAVHALGVAALMPLQYRPFCGGCTLDAGLYSLLLSWLPPSLHTWKLVPMGLGAVALGTVAAVTWWRLGRTAGLLVAALVVATPPSWTRLGLVAWGNHYEASTAVLLTLAGALVAGDRPRRWFGVGVLLGLGCWSGLSAAFAVVAVGAFLVVERRRASIAWLVPGVIIGFGPALARWWLTGESPLSTIYEPGESLPSLARIPAKLATLVPPRQLAGMLGIRDPVWGPVAGVTAAISALAAVVTTIRRPGPARLPAFLVLAWLAVYLVVRFQLSVAPPGVVPTAGDVRYAAPVVIVGAVTVCLAAGRLLAAGRRLGAILLVLPWILAGVGHRAASLVSPFPNAGARHMRAADFEYFREQASWALPRDLRVVAAASSHRLLREFAAYADGRDALLAALPDPERRVEAPTLEPPLHRGTAWAEGVAAALTDRLDPDADGDAASLRRAHRLLAMLSATWPADWRAAARRAICWRRVDGGAADAPLAHATDEAGLRSRLADGSSPDGDEVQAARAFCAGRRWGRDRAARWQPAPVDIPESALRPPALEAAFAAGLGRALGDAWGPAADEVMPHWRHEGSAAAYHEGVRQGSRARWLVSTPDAPLP